MFDYKDGYCRRTWYLSEVVDALDSRKLLYVTPACPLILCSPNTCSSTHNQISTRNNSKPHNEPHVCVRLRWRPHDSLF